MAQSKYDIFISYRRNSGAQYARILQLMLQQRGYRVFLDYDELTDGIFGDHIKAAIKDAPVFMLVLSERSMERCLNADDWVRQEILLAIELQKHLVPVNPDNKFDGFPEDTPERQLPRAIREQVSSHQYSEIGFGQTLGVTIDLMIKNRLVPTLGERNANGRVDADYDSAQETLRRIDAHNRFMKRLGITGVALAVLLVLGVCLWFWNHQMDKERREAEQERLTALCAELEEKYRGFHLQLNTDLSEEQMLTIDTLLQNMAPVRPDTLWMSQYEFTVGLWYGIKGEPFDEAQRYMPKTDVSYGDITMFLITLGNITNLTISLPSVEEWEYAARGGAYHETSTYVGSDDPGEVAWYKDNSGGTIHASDGQQGLRPNQLDLFDMSGNVSELCNTAYAPGTDNSPYTVCGGNYASSAAGVTISSRAPFGNNAKADTVGFRIIISM